MRAPAVSLLLLVVATGPFSRAETPTYSKDVAKILHQHCAACHRPGEVGPFSLLTYEDAAKRAQFIADLAKDKVMPPWKADTEYSHFKDVRTLSDAEIKTLVDWASSGAPRGDSKEEPAPPKFTEGWQLGEPDLILKMSDSFTVPAEGADIYRCFVIPIPIDQHKMVSAIEFRPGNRSVVHHALFFLDGLGQGKLKDARDPGLGFESFGGPGIIPTGGLGGWAPGMSPRNLPDGTARFLKKGQDLIMQVHYHPTGKEEKDQSMVGIHFADKPVKQIISGIAVRSRDIYIKPGEKRHHVTAESGELPVDVNAMFITPHMHMLGKEVKVRAVTPDGKEIPLIWIKDWDFNWQDSYQFKEPVRIPKGSVVKLDAYYDNSADNPRNPSSPPKLVKWGEQTTDEMCLLSLQVVTDKVGDIPKLMAMRGNALGAALGGGLLRGNRIEDLKGLIKE